jgi:SAM-dependent methyltransferase
VEDHVYPLTREAEERHWWFLGRRAVIDVLLNRAGPPSPPRILDAGCGTGRNLETLARLGEAEGIDPSPQAVDFCRDRGIRGVQVADATALPFEDGRFGLISATDVVEHIEDDRRALAEMRRVSAPGGALLLTVPAYGWLWTAEDERLQHYRRYTRRTLTDAVTAAGWRPVFATYFNTILLPAIAVARLLSGSSDSPELERTPGSLNGVLSLPMRAEAWLLGKGIRLPFGVSIGMVCRPLP